jgi:hypothetical protein
VTRVAALCALVVTGGPVAARAHGPLSRTGSHSLRAQVRLTNASWSVPRSFLGLSVEVSELSSYVRAGAVFDRALSLLRPASHDPMVLRVGGKSADDAYWDVPAPAAPSWVFELGNDWLTQLATLVRQEDLRVTLDLNVAVHAPSMAADFAKAVFEALQPHGLAGLSIGNEPDLFVHQPGLQRERVAATIPSTPKAWTRDYSPSSYRRDYVAYARAVSAAVPGIPLAGPESASHTPGWLSAVTALGPLTPRALTLHRYPSSACWAPDSPGYPRISLLLAERSSKGLAGGLRNAIAFAHSHGMAFLVTELNSVSCGGIPGVANSFATALWAPDALFELMSAGVDGVNWHIRPYMLNAPFELRAGAIEPLPELYGLALFAQMLQPPARRAAVQLSTARGLDLKAWAVTSGTQTRVLLINKGRANARVSLRGGQIGGRARLQRLLAPRVSSVSGVTLGGRWIGRDARWHGREQQVWIGSRGGQYHVLVSGYSAALLQVRLSTAAHSAAARRSPGGRKEER